MNKTRHSSPSQSSASFRLPSAAGLPLCTRRLPPIPMWNIHAPSKWHSDGRSGSCMDCCLQALSQNGRRVPERGRARGSFRFLCRLSFEGDGEILRPKSATHHGRIDRCMLVLCSEAHWHSATSLRWCWRSPKALLVLMEVMEWSLRAGIREEFCSAVGATDKVHGVLWSLEFLENPK